MDLEEVLEALSYAPEDGIFPSKAVRRAEKLKNEITPILLRELELCIEKPEEMVEDPDYIRPLFALLLLAKFRENKAFPLILKMFIHRSDAYGEYFSDIVSENLSSILISTFNGELDLIKNMLLDTAVEFTIKEELSILLIGLVLNNIVPRDKIQQLQLELLSRLKHDHPEDLLTYSYVVQDSILLFPEGSLREKVKWAIKNLKLDEELSLSSLYDEIIQYDYESIREEMIEDSSHDFIEDIQEITDWWEMFIPDDDEVDEYGFAPHDKGPIVSREKVGRNDPCTCGSGKKFKKCCGK